MIKPLSFSSHNYGLPHNPSESNAGMIKDVMGYVESMAFFTRVWPETRW